MGKEKRWIKFIINFLKIIQLKIEIIERRKNFTNCYNIVLSLNIL